METDAEVKFSRFQIYERIKTSKQEYKMFKLLIEYFKHPHLMKYVF